MTYRRRHFTEQELKFARTMRMEGVPWRALAAQFDCDWESIRRAMDPDFAEARARQIREAREKRGSYVPSTGVSADVDRTRRQIPRDVLLERDAANASSVSLTATIFGDPLPGRSALDKKRSEAGA